MNNSKKLYKPFFIALLSVFLFSCTSSEDNDSYSEISDETFIEDNTAIDNEEKTVEDDTVVDNDEIAIEDDPIIDNGDTVIEDDPIVDNGDTVIEDDPIVDNGDTVIEDDPIVADDDDIIENAQILINWDDNADNELGYIIERRLQSSELYDEVITLSEDSNSYEDQTVYVGQSYCYQVSAFNQAGSAVSDEVCIDI